MTIYPVNYQYDMPLTFDQRMTALVGTPRYISSLARAIEMTVTHVHKAIRADTPPTAAIVALEFMEKTAPDKWPERFREIREMKEKHCKCRVRG